MWINWKKKFADLELGLNKAAEAAQIYREIQGACKNAWGLKSQGYYYLVWNRGLAERRSGDVHAADSCYREGLELCAMDFGTQGGDYFNALGIVAEFYLETEWYAQAESTITRTLALEKAARGSKDTLIVQALSRLGLVYEKTNRLESARETYDVAISMLKDLGGNKTFMQFLLWSGMGRSYEALGETDQAIDAFREAKQLIESIPKPRPSNYRAAIISLARALRSADHLKSADSLLVSYLSTHFVTQPTDTSQSSLAIMELARVRQPRRSTSRPTHLSCSIFHSYRFSYPG